MPHGDFSDYAAYTHLALGFASIFAPQHVWFGSIGPLKAMLEGEATATALALGRFAGGPFFFMALTLFVVRWNTINGKAGAIGCVVAALNSIYIALSMDSFSFVPRGWYVLAAFHLATAYHLAFNANPMLTSAMLAEKEAAKAKKEADKAKSK